jgi:glycosyltransferase involved in cell wall biosynthesis
MLSVCIPIYNVDIRLLADQVKQQAGTMQVSVEIICFDDASDEKYKTINRELKTDGGIFYKEFQQNAGRAAIRNELGKAATQPWLLFLDADSMIEKEDFLKKYLDAVESADVICGGTAYTASPPPDTSRLLRWTYGRKREQLTSAQRMQNNKFAITANNFMIRRRIFQECPFREEIKGYGHEDTVLGYDIFQAEHKIKHIDNPVVHTGLETSAEYLGKTKSALSNLIYISENIIRDERFIGESGLLRLYNRLKTLRLLPVVRYLFLKGQPFLEKNLTGRNPRLFLFDLFRIGYLCSKKITG